MPRLQSLDFLRGIAVILVLFRHHWIGSDALQRVGWVGVDLFFVLSGFLVSGLLFAEQKKFGNVKPARFLVRRGFKIYPTFYVSLLITAIASYFIAFPELQDLSAMGQVVVWRSEILFLQNYSAYIWGHHWSLAVEEHFYLLVALAFPFMFRRIGLAPVVFVGCLLMRIWTATYSPGTPAFAPTHLRIDSLLAGVCIAYVYHYGDLGAVHKKYRPLLLAFACIPVLFLLPGFEVESYFTSTIGFSLLYIAFGSWLILFLYSDVKRFMWRPITVIGFYSYGIYLFHLYMLRFVVGETYHFPGDYTLRWSTVASFAIYLVGGLALGIGMSYLIEKPFLALRDRTVPRRT